MVKPEHRMEYNRWQAEEAIKRRGIVVRFLRSKYAMRALFGVFVILLCVPIALMIFEPRLFHPDYICGMRAQVVMVDTPHNFGILANTSDERISALLRSQKRIYNNTAPVIKRILRAGDVAVDVGAGFGYHTLLMADLVGTGGTVYAFEPRADVVHLIEASALVNRMPQVKVQQALVYSSNVNVLMETFPYQMEASRIVGNKTLVGSDSQDINVATAYKLDNLLPNPYHIKLLRINAMGAELSVLEGAQSIISRSPSISILIPWNPEWMRAYSNVGAMIDDLLDLGFEFWAINSDSSLKLITKDVLLQYVGDVLITREYID